MQELFTFNGYFNYYLQALPKFSHTTNTIYKSSLFLSAYIVILRGLGVMKSLKGSYTNQTHQMDIRMPTWTMPIIKF